ncbi:MAG: plasmid mobilization protein [Planctomycetota bacterium]
MAKKKGGRPRKRASERRSVTPSLRLTPGEAELIQTAADAKGLPVTQWMREALLRAARRAKGGE